MATGHQDKDFFGHDRYTRPDGSSETFEKGFFTDDLHGSDGTTIHKDILGTTHVTDKDGREETFTENLFGGGYTGSRGTTVTDNIFTSGRTVYPGQDSPLGSRDSSADYYGSGSAFPDIGDSYGSFGGGYGSLPRTHGSYPPSQAQIEAAKKKREELFYSKRADYYDKTCCSRMFDLLHKSKLGVLIVLLGWGIFGATIYNVLSNCVGLGSGQLGIRPMSSETCLQFGWQLALGSVAVLICTRGVNVKNRVLAQIFCGAAGIGYFVVCWQSLAAFYPELTTERIKTLVLIPVITLASCVWSYDIGTIICRIRYPYGEALEAPKKPNASDQLLMLLQTIAITVASIYLVHHSQYIYYCLDKLPHLAWAPIVLLIIAFIPIKGKLRIQVRDQLALIVIVAIIPYILLWRIPNMIFVEKIIIVIVLCVLFKVSVGVILDDRIFFFCLPVLLPLFLLLLTLCSSILLKSWLSPMTRSWIEDLIKLTTTLSLGLSVYLTIKDTILSHTDYKAYQEWHSKN